MIKYSKNQNVLDCINIEVQVINSYLSLQTALTEQLSVFINSKINKSSLDNAIVNLNRLKQNIVLLNNLLDVLENLKSTMSFLTDSGLETYLKDYNSLYSTNITTIFAYTSKIQEFIRDISLEIMGIEKRNKHHIDNDNKSNYILSNIDSSTSLCNTLVNNTLVISEIKNQVILPYNLENVKVYFNNNLDKYSTIDEVIKQNYIYPISHFKPFAISRFKEAYILMRKREHSSRMNALSLAFELLTNYNLHPAIIASCKTIDDLDIYLACLEDNRLDNFDKFNIKYEIPPAKIKESKKIVLENN